MEMDLDGDSELGHQTPADKRPSALGRQVDTPRSASGSAARTSPFAMSPISTPVFEKEVWIGNNGHENRTDGAEGQDGRHGQIGHEGRGAATPTANMPFGGIGVGAVKVDSFRPGGK